MREKENLKYGNLTKSILEAYVDEDYEKGELTLQQYLDEEFENENVEFAEWNYDKKNKYLEHLIIWTTNYVMWYEGNLPFDGMRAVPRNPMFLKKKDP